MKCPKHPNQTMRPLKYQKPNGKKTAGGNNGTAWHNVGYSWCEACAEPVKVTVTIHSHNDAPRPAFPVQL